MDIPALLRAVADVAESNPKFLSAILSAMEPDQPKPEKKYEPLFQAGQWPIPGSTLEWIQSRWPGVDCQVPLQRFIDYWAGTGKSKTSKNWELTLRKNPPFAAEMNKKQLEAGGNDTVRSEARRLYAGIQAGEKVYNNSPAAAWLVKEGHCYVEGKVLRIK